jgi:hypothetical protein
MINFVVAFDNQNAELGQYFNDCKNDIVNIFDEQNGLVHYNEVPTPQCNEAYIDVEIPQLNSDPFIFIAYTHGNDDGLMCNGGSFVSIDNCYHFINSLFYSTACLIGKNLAPELVNKGCRAFIGFKEESEIFKNASYRQTFINCDNFALKMFITSDASVGESFDAMKNHYTKEIDRLTEFREDPIFISVLVANREALVCLGDRELRKEDFFVS